MCILARFSTRTQVLFLLVHLASIHFNHLESAQCLHLIFDLRPQLVQFLRSSIHRRVCCCGKKARSPFTPWFRHISVYIYAGNDRGRVISCIPGVFWNLFLSAILLVVINTKAFGHGQWRREGASGSLQPFLQRGTQVLVRLQKTLTECICVTRYMIFNHLQ